MGRTNAVLVVKIFNAKKIMQKSQYTSIDQGWDVDTSILGC